MELDADIVAVAKDWFELSTNNQLTVVIEDALQHTQNLVERGEVGCESYQILSYIF